MSALPKSPKRSKINSECLMDPEIYNDSKRPEFLVKAGFVFNSDCDLESETELKDSPTHAVLFETSNGELTANNSGQKGNAKALQTPISQEDWDKHVYVKLPFYEYNKEPETNKCLWSVIKKSLTELAETLNNDFDYIHVEYAILKYNRKYKNKWNFSILHQLFDQISEQGQEDHMRQLIQKMIKLALDMPNQFRKPIPILKAGKTSSVSLTQEQCACILANAFFCTFPGRIGHDNPSDIPYINFNGLLSDSGYRKNQVKIEKLVCLFHYFNRVLTKMPEGVVTVSRLTLTPDETPSFDESKASFQKCLILQEGTIEDCDGAIQLDFANMYMGGGVLSSGCVQEEIRFLICPELIVSLLFTECMQDNEAVIIKGCERYSSYKGYASSFKWNGDYVDSTKRDKWSRRYTHVLAIDALRFTRFTSQFEESKITRELVKCYTGLKKTLENIQPSNDRFPVVATGNWGCGAFNGDKQLKFIIQLMAAAMAHRDLVYYTFNDSETYEDLTDILEMIKSKNLNVSQVHEILADYAGYVELAKSRKPKKSSSARSSDSSDPSSPEKSTYKLRPLREFLQARLQASS